MGPGDRRFRRALELKPGLASTYNNLGMALRAQGRLDEAIAAYRRAVELKADDADLHSNLGIALQETGRIDEAIAAYRRAIELKGDYAVAHNNLGIALEEQGGSTRRSPPSAAPSSSIPRYAEAHD